ncbi:hypothetical protein Hanom_Chr05g00404561 [Helianthus anomalus]
MQVVNKRSAISTCSSQYSHNTDDIFIVLLLRFTLVANLSPLALHAMMLHLRGIQLHHSKTFNIPSLAEKIPKSSPVHFHKSLSFDNDTPAIQLPIPD